MNMRATVTSILLVFPLGPTTPPSGAAPLQPF